MRSDVPAGRLFGAVRPDAEALYNIKEYACGSTPKIAEAAAFFTSVTKSRMNFAAMNRKNVQPLKRTVMKKFLMLAAAMLALGVFAARADNDRPITVGELPRKAQEFIQKFFPDEKVSFAKVESDLFETTYEVIFTGGSKIEFLKNGDWKEVDCKYSTVPLAIVPQQIVRYVKGHYPDAAIVQIDRGRRDYEVELSNGLELTFDLQFRLIDIDD